MIKVFLVEDEKIVREGIKSEIPWGRYGMELVGEAADGELAYPLIQQTKPDILLTDIRMPFMDGLELAELIRHEMPDVRIIFFSGYDDFEYAKKAIQIGASDYLLKPVSSTQLLAALEQMNEQILQMRSDKEYMGQFKREMEEQKLWERERLFDEIIRGESSRTELINKAKGYGIDFTAAAYNVVLFQFQNPVPYVPVSEKINEAYREIKALLKGNRQIIGFDRLLEGMAFIIKAEHQEEIDKRVELWIKELKNIAEIYTDLSYFGGVGVPVIRFSEIRESYRAAGKAFAYRYMTEQCQILTYQKLSNIQRAENSDSTELGDVDVSGWDKEAVEHFLRDSSLEAADYFIEDYLERIAGNLESLMFRHYILMDIYVTASRYAKEIGISDEVIGETLQGIDQMMKASQSLTETKNKIRKILKQALILRDTVSQKRYSQLLEHARSYIDKNYQNESISLSAVAAQVNLSSSHFSAIFSQEMGITFIEYLTSVRMKQARHLLRFTDLRASEISYRVGYKDPHYFSYLFKKTQGISPKNYRGGNA